MEILLGFAKLRTLIKELKKNINYENYRTQKWSWIVQILAFQ